MRHAAKALHAPPIETAKGYMVRCRRPWFEAVKRGFVSLARGGGHESAPRSE